MPIDTTEPAYGNNFGNNYSNDYCSNPNLPDPVLPPLSHRQADRLVCLALHAAADLDLTLTYRGGAALVPTDPASDKPMIGLSNLARVVARYEEENWPDLVEEHLRHILEQLHDGSPPLPADPERELLQRIVPRDALPTDWATDRPDFVPGLISVPSMEADGIITMFLEPSDLDLSWSDAERFGLTNLRRLQDNVEFVEHEDLQIAFVSGDGYAASRALVLDTVLRETLQVEHAPYGVLATLPTRDTLILHVIEDLGVIPALGLLLNLAARCYSRDPGPLSPDVFLVTPDFTWHPATTAPTDQAPLRLSPELESLAEQLATREPNGTEPGGGEYDPHVARRGTRYGEV